MFVGFYGKEIVENYSNVAAAGITGSKIIDGKWSY
jgi:hypothetical protein